MIRSEMRFYVISDLHLTQEGAEGELKSHMAKLCEKIRSSTPMNSVLLFIILGDVINRGDVRAYEEAEKFLHDIQSELTDFEVHFEFVPGNHDWADGTITPYNELIEHFKVAPFSDGSAYAKEYGGVNFIFANSTQEDYGKPGRLDLTKIKGLTRSDRQNVLCCHHGISHTYGDEHNIIENSAEVQSELADMGVRMVLHGHTHQAESRETVNGLCEIGCGSFAADLSGMDKIYNQFMVGYIRDGAVIHIERWLLVADGNSNWTQSVLYPYEQDFVDPSDIDKKHYELPSPYIARRVIPHEIFMRDPFEQGWYYDGTAVDLETAVKEQPYVLLLSDAGMGKSIEMQYLAGKLCDTPFFPFYFSLCNYSGGTIKALLPPTYQNLYPDRWMLLLDGYDEMQKGPRDEFHQQLNLLLNDGIYSMAHIVITARSNFCKAEVENRSRTFEGFTAYDLRPLDGEDIRTYLEENDIDAEEFQQAAAQSNVLQLLKNPFYLTRLAERFRKSHSLPGRHAVMEELVRDCFRWDDKKFWGEDLEDQFQAQQQTLMKMAFGMQLLQKQKLDDWDEYQALFDDKARRPAHFSGLIHKNGTAWAFTHNNFREYFAAKFVAGLPREDAIDYLYDGKGIRENWVNVLAYLSEMELDWDLHGWLAEYAPAAYVKFEPEHLSNETRFQTFYRIFQEAEEKCLWIDSDLCSLDELARFGCTWEVLAYLMDKVERPVHEMSQLCAISILQYLPDLFGRNDEIRRMLMSCSLSADSAVAGRCIQAMTKLRLDTEEVTDRLISHYWESEDNAIRWRLYELLTQTGRQDAHVDFFLRGIRYLGGNGQIVNAQVALEDGLGALSQPAAIMAAIRYLTVYDDHRLHRRGGILKTLCKTAAEQYEGGREEYYGEMLKGYVLAADTAYFDEAASIIFHFFEQTQTAERAVVELCNRYTLESNVFYALFAVGKHIDCLHTAYLEQRLSDPKLFAGILRRFADDDQYEAYRQMVGLPERPPRVDHAEERRRGEREYFASLFDREKVQALLEQLLRTTGLEDKTVEEVAEADQKIEYHSPLLKLQHALRWYKAPGSLGRDFFRDMDWDHFLCGEAARMIKNEQYKDATEEQKQGLHEAVQRLLGRNVLADGVSFHDNTCSVASVAGNVIFLISYFDFPVAREYILQMTPYPDIYFANGDEKSKYAFLETRLSPELLLEQIEKSVVEQRVQGFILTEFIQYCTKRESPAIKETAIALFQDEHTEDGGKYAIIDYLYKTSGSVCLEQVVLPKATEHQLLHIAYQCKGVSKEALKNAMERQFAASSSYELMKHLITMESDMALAAYIADSREKMEPCEQEQFFASGPTKAIETIRAPRFLPRLKELAELLFDPAFQDREIISLFSSLSEAFFRCGCVNAQETEGILEELRRTYIENETAVRFCSYTLDRIAREKRRQKNRPMTLRQVKKLFDQLQ